jgi:quinol monooxygenase YgiN
MSVTRRWKMAETERAGNEIRRLARYHVRLESLDRCLAAIHEFVASVRLNEPGTLRYEAWQEREEPTRFVHIFTFRDAEAERIHSESAAVDKLGLKVATDYRQDDGKWWVSLTLPAGGASITITTFHENMKPGTMKIYFATSDVAAAHKELSAKGAKVSEVKDDLFGPGSGVKWLDLQDPDGNEVLLVQA